MKIKLAIAIAATLLSSAAMAVPQLYDFTSANYTGTLSYDPDAAFTGNEGSYYKWYASPSTSVTYSFNGGSAVTQQLELVVFSYGVEFYTSSPYFSLQILSDTAFPAGFPLPTSLSLPQFYGANLGSIGLSYNRQDLTSFTAQATEQVPEPAMLGLFGLGLLGLGIGRRKAA